MGGPSVPVSCAAALAGFQADVGGVGFWRGGEMDHGLRQMQLGFGRADEMHGVLGGVADQQRGGIGEADVFGGRAHEAAGDEQQILAAGDHAREPIERRVRIGAADAFVQRGDEIVVLFAVLVVGGRALLQEFAERLGVERRLPVCSANNSSASVSR